MLCCETSGTISGCLFQMHICSGATNRSGGAVGAFSSIQFDEGRRSAVILMTHPDESQFTISILDISTALGGVSRTTLWRLFRGQEMAHVRFLGIKHFVASDVITRLRQRPNHNVATETILLNIDKQRRLGHQQKAQQNDT